MIAPFQARLVGVGLIALGGALTAAPQIVAPDGAWTWFNDPRAVVRSGWLHTGYVRSDGRVCVTAFNLRARESAEMVLSSWTERDDHDNPALLHLADGRLFAAYAGHGSSKFWNFRLARNGAPRHISDWGPEQRVDLSASPLRGGVTYNNLFRLRNDRDRLYNFLRGIAWNPTVQISDDEGATWGEPIHLIASPDRPYVKFASNGRDRIDLVFTDGHPRTTDNSVHHVYLRDGGLHRTDGGRVGPLGEATPLAISQASHVYVFGAAYPRGRAWVWDVAYDDRGNPVVVHTVKAATNDIRYFYASWDRSGARWISREIARAGAPLYSAEQDYVGGITLDPAHAGVVYLSSAVDPRTDAPTVHREIYRGRTKSEGRSWRWEAVTSGSASDNLRPFVPRQHPLRECVLWFRGVYRSYTEFRCEVVGHFR